VAASNIEIVRTGLDAYQRGDIDAVAAILAPDVRWEGVGGVEPCVSREQAVAALRAGAGQAKGLELADAVPFGTDKVMVCLVRSPVAGEGGEALPSRIYNVVTFTGETVVRMQGFLGRKEAVQAARGADAAAKPSGPSKPAGPRKRSAWRRFRMAVGRMLGRS